MKSTVDVVRSFGLGLLAFGVAAVAAAQGNPACGSLKVGYGPYDYRSQQDKLEIVERFHFSPEVESLQRGISTSKVGGDLSYVLRAFPNHHRALMSMVKLAAKERKATPAGSTYSVECWFDRANRFAPDDGMVKVLNGLYLLNIGQNQEAVTKLEEGARLAGDNANVHYNLGLAYMRVKRHDKALESAHRAYAMGFPLPGLREQLKRAGAWREP